jgi:hypothetical protein
MFLVPDIQELTLRLSFMAVHELKQSHSFSLQGTGCSAKDLVLGVAILI